jgi:hypothetical protein
MHSIADAKKRPLLSPEPDFLVAETGKSQERAIIDESATWILLG